MLAGTGQGLLQRGMEGLGLSSATRLVGLTGLADFDAAFICNSATPACAVPAFAVWRPMALSKASDMLLFESLSSGVISSCNGAD